MKNILITGGAGYIGSMLATKLVNLNFNVTVIDILKFSKSCVILFAPPLITRKLSEANNRN